MPKKWDKKVLTVLMEWDYCDPKRGPSLDKQYFFNTLSELSANVEPFWYDAYINDAPRLQRLLLEKADACKPDLVFFVPYLDHFQYETLDLLKKKAATAAWFGDDTWRFENYSSKLAPHFTHVCTTDPFSAAKYKALGITPIFTQWAAQPPREAPSPLPPAVYNYDVSFVGGHNTLRAWFIKRLEELGVTVACFGSGWPSGKVSFEEMSRIFLTSRINLNLSNSVNHDIRFVLGSARNFVTYLRSQKRAEQIKARNFEIPAAGGFQLTNYVAGLERYYNIGGETVVFSSPEECAVQIKYYLANEAERLRVLLAARERTAREHTYLNRLSDVLAAIWR